jgi:hypothetical protein
MSLELDVDAVYGASTVGFDSFEDKEESQSTHFHKSIYAPPYYPVQFEDEAALSFQTQESLKAEAVVADKFGHKVTDKGASGGVEVTIDFGPSGPTYEMSGWGRYEGENGNYVEASGSYKSDGTGSASAGTGNVNDE